MLPSTLSVSATGFSCVACLAPVGLRKLRVGGLFFTGVASNGKYTRIYVHTYNAFVLFNSPRVPLRRYVDTYTLNVVKMTRAAFAILFGVHIPEWLPRVWVNGTRYVLLSGREEVGELDRLMSLTEEPLCSAFEAVRPKT